MDKATIKEREAIFSALASNATKNNAVEDNMSLNSVIKNRSREVAKFYGLETLEPASQMPPIGGATPGVASYSGYVYRYKSGFLSDVAFRAELENIMTSGLNGGKYSPIMEWQTFTKEGDCVIAIKYLEKVDTADEEPLFKEYRPKLQDLDSSILGETSLEPDPIVDVKGDK